jgi:cyclic dehypoxanthinyl futalosine synthase
VAFSEFFNEPVETILKDFVAAGMGSLPGGGGEILVDRVRNRIAPLKANTADWMGVMNTAHQLGLASSATMMFGHVETPEDRLEHLEVVRNQQDKSMSRLNSLAPPRGEGKGEGSGGRMDLASSIPARDASSPQPSPPEGEREKDEQPSPMELAASYAQALESGALRGGAFTAFICWTFQPENAVLKAPTVGAHEYLRTQALARIYLDNIPSVQSSWVTQGHDIGQIALKHGANDLGSIMIEENVVSAAGTTFRMGTADMKRLIEDLGYEARQRDNWYRLVI